MLSNRNTLVDTLYWRNCLSQTKCRPTGTLWLIHFTKRTLFLKASVVRQEHWLIHFTKRTIFLKPSVVQQEPCGWYTLLNELCSISKDTNLNIPTTWRWALEDISLNNTTGGGGEGDVFNCSASHKWLLRTRIITSENFWQGSKWSWQMNPTYNVLCVCVCVCVYVLWRSSLFSYWDSVSLEEIIRLE